uniref:Uncharacterized protein n=1 Tax=Lactuca sativa TaxID=4236 RepID=A0A9R1WWR4_LACSA|nr:hypothetical protein LSAT_V11C800433900 [Lactuca sativa]
MVSDAKYDSKSLALTPTSSIAIVMTIFVLVQLLVEQSIRYLCNWLKKVKRKPMLAVVEKMKNVIGISYMRAMNIIDLIFLLLSLLS